MEGYMMLREQKGGFTVIWFTRKSFSDKEKHGREK